METVMKLKSYASGEWRQGDAKFAPLFNAVNGKLLAESSSDGLDFRAMLEYGRCHGGTALRKMTFHQRANMLKALAKHLDQHKDGFYKLSTATGATRADSLGDIDGGISTLFVYAIKGRRELPNDTMFVDGASERISRNGSFVGQHICVPLEGVAVHINAFNFPCWGMLEKLAPALLAGVPVIVKPATSTSYLTECVFRCMIDAGILPDGAVQLICGSTGDLLTHLTCQDLIAFTGSASTAEKLQQHPNVVAQSVRFTAETDSLNCSVLGPDVEVDSPEFSLYVDEIVKEMISKAGQKCTAIRRAIAPRTRTAALIEALQARLKTVRIGNPGNERVEMGALASQTQRDEVRNAVNTLLTGSETVFGALSGGNFIDADLETGAFMSPILLHCENPSLDNPVHSVEAFGPVATVVPYDSLDDAVALAKLGGGSLAASLFTYNDDVVRTLVVGTAAYHGRMLVVNRDCAAESTGHGVPLPHLVHGGPGRAGGGEEMGGIRGVMHYMQRTALQGAPDTLTGICNKWLPGSSTRQNDVHPFRKHFDELQLGDTLVTATRTVTLEDIEQFATHTGDNFYAHMDEEAAKANPFFEGRVAHGYFIVAAAAGLFVQPDPGPVLANYGLENLQFTQPVYPGDTIQVRLSCKQKSVREAADYGEVRWDVEVTNQAGVPVAAYDVLTLVQR